MERGRNDLKSSAESRSPSWTQCTGRILWAPGESLRSCPPWAPPERWSSSTHTPTPPPEDHGGPPQKMTRKSRPARTLSTPSETLTHRNNEKEDYFLLFCSIYFYRQIPLIGSVLKPIELSCTQQNCLSQQNPPNCYSKLVQSHFEGGPPVKITFRGVKYVFLVGFPW